MAQSENGDGVWWRTLLGAVVVVVLVALLAVVVWAIVPDRTPHIEDASALDAVLADRWILWICRLVVLFGAIYVVASLVALMARKQWLAEAGPFKAGDTTRAVRALTEERDRLEDRLREANATVDHLTSRLSVVTDSLSATLATEADSA
jgi:hypothetical protein